MSPRTHTIRTLGVCAVVLLSVLATGGLAAEDATVADGGIGDRGVTTLPQAPSAVAQTNGTGQQTNTTVTQAGGGSLVFAPRVFQDIGGQVATEDGEVRVEGLARGYDEVLVAMIDRRGRIASEIITVDDDDRFEEDVALLTPRGSELGEGPIVATVYTPGRDEVMGNGEIAGFTREDLTAFDEGIRQKIGRELANRSVTRTQQQVLELFYEESINESGSDDQALFDVFRYTDGRTSLEAVRPTANPNLTGLNPVRQGETMVIRGRTNRKPEDTTITVEVTDGPTTELFDVAATDQWGLVGIWRVTIDVPPDAEPGTYTLRSDDGDDTDTVQIEVRPDARNGTVRNQSEP